jgi:phosphotransferase system enzyme I (PtsI)
MPVSSMSEQAHPKPELVVQGIPASQGIAYGQVFVYLQSDLEVPAYEVEPEKRADEVARFDHAVLVTRGQIQRIRDEVERNLGADEARIFDAHLLVLEDQALIAETIRSFEKSGRNIESCFNEVARRYVVAFTEIDDEYLRERAGDIRDVAQRVLANLLGQSSENLSRLVDKRVVVANDISPSDAASIDRSHALGVITDTGSKTSHAVIVARSMKVPAVVGARGLSAKVHHGDWILVDGYDGLVIVHPSEQTLFRYGKIQVQKKSLEQRLMLANQRPSVTLDGVEVVLRANIENAEETPLVKEYLASGVGLYRTEFLYLNGSQIPGEEEQFQAYRRVAEQLAPATVVIRSLDLGGDKAMEGNPTLFPREDNPFLGFRAIRFCLENPNLFKEQLRAILRASVSGNVKLMYPMISGCEELARANAVLEECREELRAAGVPFDEKLAVGSMIEIPSAAYTADLLAVRNDFFSIGTNDLIQYLLAIDRVNDRIAHLYEPTHPAVIRTIRHIVREAHAAGIKVSVCGEMAGDPVLAPLLLGLGVDELSMTPPLIPAVRYVIRAMTLADARALAEEALTLSGGREVLALCEQFHCARVRFD